MDKMVREYKSMIEIERKFYPRAYKMKIINNMTASELGEYFAKRAIDSIKPQLEKILRNL